MPIRISNDLKERIVLWYYTDKKTMEEVRDLSRCSIGLISNVLRNYQEYGEVQNPFTRKAGRPCILNDDDISFIQTLINANPSLTSLASWVPSKLWSEDIIQLHRQVTLLNLLCVFRRCDDLNRECARLKNGGWCLDCDERILSLTHLWMRLAHPHYWPREFPWCCPGPSIPNPPLFLASFSM